MGKRRTIFIGIMLVIVSAVLSIAYFPFKHAEKKAHIKIGILHSQTGALASLERPVSEAGLLAIDEINKQGGINGYLLKPIIADGKSNWDHFAKEAERLIVEEKVLAIFGCITSASRKTVKPIIEKYNNLLIYPMQYEGVEQSPNIMYLGEAPNQQTLPAVMWCINNLGKRFFLVGSDYIYPRIAHEIIKDQINSLGGTVVGEMFVKLGTTQVGPIVEMIKKSKPNVILNNLVGKDNNSAFFKALYNDPAITPEEMPVMSFAIGEQDFSDLEKAHIAGNYATWNYMQSIFSERNREFVKAFKEKYGAHRVISDPMEAEYVGVYIWAQTVKEYKTAQPEVIKDALKGQSFYAPEGTVYIDDESRHSWKIVRLGKIRSDGQFTILWDSQKPIRPIPYPLYQDKAFWEKLLLKFYHQWGNKWEND